MRLVLLSMLALQTTNLVVEAHPDYFTSYHAKNCTEHPARAYGGHAAPTQDRQGMNRPVT